MEYLLFFVLGIVAGWGVWRMLAKRGGGDDFEGNPLNAEQIQKRKDNLDKIVKLAAEKGRVTNNDVEKHLGVSDATATRYLSYLTGLGKLVKMGERGREVFYQVPR